MRDPDPQAAVNSVGARTELNSWLADRTATERVAWALANTEGGHALASSFGAQSAVSLHLITRLQPNIPVILIDTGYLFPETYRFVDELVARLRLNLKVYSATLSPAWMEARRGRLWENGASGIDQYNRIRKVEPMYRALQELGVNTWFSGIRRSQSESRRGIGILEVRSGRWKMHPLADWSDHDVWTYLREHDLPYHPLWHKGYVSIGDTHTTRPLEANMRDEDTRFFGLQRECGLHTMDEFRRDAEADQPPRQAGLGLVAGGRTKSE